MNYVTLSGSTVKFLRLVSGMSDRFDRITNAFSAMTDRVPTEVIRSGAGRAIGFFRSAYATLTCERNIRRYRAALWLVKELAIIAWMILAASAISIKQWCDTEVDRYTAKNIAVEGTIAPANDAIGSIDCRQPENRSTTLDPTIAATSPNPRPTKKQRRSTRQFKIAAT